MSDRSVNAHLREAASSVESARAESVPPDVEDYLDGVEELLAHHLDSGPTGPEAMMHPTASALDTVQERLAGIDQDVEGPASEHLQAARAQVLQAILRLDEREGEGRPVSSWR